MGWNRWLITPAICVYRLHDQDKWRLVEGRMQPNDIASEGSCAYPWLGANGF